MFGLAKVSLFVTLARRVIMSVDAQGSEKRIVSDRFWMQVCKNMDSEAFMPLDWIQEAEHIKNYGARLVELKMTPELNSVNQFGVNN